MKNVMIDIETMSKEKNAAIASIGAVYFTEDGIVDTFYQTIDLQSCKDLGLHVDPDTVRWWLTQSKEALAALRVNTVPIFEALTKFSEWFPDKNACVWGNGVAFDNVIVASAYKAAGLNLPWKWWNDRCYRTIKAVIEIPEDAREGVHHNALDDAMHQTKHLLKILGS